MPIQALQDLKPAYPRLGILLLTTNRTLWIHYEPGLDQDSLYYENPIYPTLMGDRITVSQNITVSMNLVSNSSWKAYVLSVLSLHLPEKMMVGPSREGWEISTYVLARLLQNPSSFWLTSSLLNEFWARELAHVWKLSKNAEHLVSYGVAFLSLLVIYSWLIVVWSKSFSWWLPVSLAPKNTVSW